MDSWCKWSCYTGQIGSRLIPRIQVYLRGINSICMCESNGTEQVPKGNKITWHYFLLQKEQRSQCSYVDQASTSLSPVRNIISLYFCLWTALIMSQYGHQTLHANNWEYNWQDTVNTLWPHFFLITLPLPHGHFPSDSGESMQDSHLRKREKIDCDPIWQKVTLCPIISYCRKREVRDTQRYRYCNSTTSRRGPVWDNSSLP